MGQVLLYFRRSTVLSCPTCQQIRETEKFAGDTGRYLLITKRFSPLEKGTVTPGVTTLKRGTKRGVQNSVTYDYFKSRDQPASKWNEKISCCVSKSGIKRKSLKLQKSAIIKN